MPNIPRRQALKGIGGIVIGGTFLPGCCFIKQFTKQPCTPFTEWKDGCIAWWEERSTWREKERESARRSGERPDVALPKPYLECGREISSRGWLREQIKPLQVNEWGEVAFRVRNKGNAASWTCYVETYEGPDFWSGVPFSKMRLTDQKIIVLQAGEIKEVVLSWQRTRYIHYDVIIRCYDPVQDPAILKALHPDRKNSAALTADWWVKDNA